jgi:hypothetical protein
MELICLILIIIVLNLGNGYIWVRCTSLFLCVRIKESTEWIDGELAHTPAQGLL